MSLKRTDLESALADAVKMQIAHLTDTATYAMCGGTEERAAAPERFERGLRNMIAVHDMASAAIDKVMPSPEPIPERERFGDPCSECGAPACEVHRDDCPRMLRALGPKP